MPRHRSMRLYDWMIDPSQVFIVGHNGRTYATDRYALIDCAHVCDRAVPAPGSYEIRATKPPVPIPHRRLTDDGHSLAQKLPEAIRYFQHHPQLHHQVTWSAWANHSVPDAPYRLGSMGGTPVAIWHDFISRLPEDHVIVGHDPTRVMLIGLDLNTTPLFIGLIMPIRLEWPQHRHHDNTVHQTIVGSLACGPVGA